ncbi:MAG: stationary phase growth adaptation protein [Plesiomonas sp.]
MNVEEVTHWRPFQPRTGPSVDLSFLDGHYALYTDQVDGKEVTYEFYVTYSFHCFAKAYTDQDPQEQADLLYRAPKDQRPFCYRRYGLARKYLRQIIENLPETIIVHAGFGSYASTKVVDDEGDEIWYFVPFKVFREKKKFRIHVTSAYPLTDAPGKGKVKFFSIAKNLKMGKPLPKPRGA